MVINLNVQYNSGFSPHILLLTQAPFKEKLYGSTALLSYIFTTYFIMYCIVFSCVQWPGMAIDVSVQYNSGSLPDIILLTQGYGEPIHHEEVVYF